MQTRTVARVLAIATFIGLVAIAYAGADHPPPPGFVIVIGLALLCAVGVWWLVPHVVDAPLRVGVLRGAGAGACAALLCALLLLLTGSGEPSVTPTLTDRLVFFAVAIVTGALGGLAVTMAARILSRPA